MPDQSAAWRTRNIGHLLYSASGLFVRQKLRTVHAAGFGAATEVHMALIQNLDLHGTRLTTIAGRASMTKQSMLELVDKAAGLGLVERRNDPEDRRAKIVVFTPRGLEMLELVHQAVALAERRMAAVMGRSFLSTMKERLTAYTATASPAAPLGMSDGNEMWRMRSVNRVLVLASGTFVRDVLRVVHESGFDAVAEVHQALFRNLDLDGTRLTEIASRARMTKQAMAELVDKAEELGFVARQLDPGDRRAKIIVFTPAGCQMLHEQRKGIASAERRMAAVTSATFVAELRAQLVAYVTGADVTDVEICHCPTDRRRGSGFYQQSRPSGQVR